MVIHSNSLLNFPLKQTFQTNEACLYFDFKCVKKQPAWRDWGALTRTGHFNPGSRIAGLSQAILAIAIQADSTPSRWGNNGNSDRLYFLGLQNHHRW